MDGWLTTDCGPLRTNCGPLTCKAHRRSATRFRNSKVGLCNISDFTNFDGWLWATSYNMWRRRACNVFSDCLKPCLCVFHRVRNLAYHLVWGPFTDTFELVWLVNIKCHTRLCILVESHSRQKTTMVWIYCDCLSKPAKVFMEQEKVIHT